jgi:hypothetical protein
VNRWVFFCTRGRERNADLLLDGLRITSARPREKQAVLSWTEVGYRVGNLAAGAQVPLRGAETLAKPNGASYGSRWFEVCHASYVLAISREWKYHGHIAFI